MFADSVRKPTRNSMRRRLLSMAVWIHILAAQSFGIEVLSRPNAIVNTPTDFLGRATASANTPSDLSSRSLAIANVDPLGSLSRAIAVSNYQIEVHTRAQSLFNYSVDVTARAVVLKNCPFGDLSCAGLADADCNDNGVFDLCESNCNHNDGACNIPGCGVGTNNDCNLNGIPDLCEAQPVICADADCNQNGVLDVIETVVSVEFSLTGNLPVGVEPYSVTASDVDGDGDADLVVVNVSDNNCSVLVNNGSGVFATGPALSVGSSPRSAAIGDFDGDGHRDIAVVNFNGNNVSILRNLGGGGFAPQLAYSAGPGPQSVVAGDLNGDGRLDLVVANTGTASNSNTVAVLMNLGAGVFDQPAYYTVGLKPRAVVLLHVDHDGLLDIASADSDPDKVTVLRNTGGGQFVATGSYDVERFPFALTAADWDGDGFTDLVAANSVANTLSVLRNNGVGGFVPMSAALPANGAPRSVQAIDVDGDGRKDIVAANLTSSTVSLFRNIGSGSFSPPITLASQLLGGCHGVAVGDFNVDGKQDWAVANRTTGTCAIGRNQSGSPTPDCNHNTRPDECDIAEGLSQDANANGVPDDCEQSQSCATCLGDVSGDLNRNGGDILAFSECMLSGAGGGCLCADMNGDGFITIEDVPALINLLLAGTPCS